MPLSLPATDIFKLSFEIRTALDSRPGRSGCVHCSGIRPSRRTPLKLIHLTDPHLTPLTDWKPGLRPSKRWLSALSWHRKRRHRHRPEQLAALVDQLRGLQPDCWAITGDLCQIGSAGEIDAATEWLQALAPPDDVLLVPGNHDVFAQDSIERVRSSWRAFLHLNDETGPGVVIRQRGEVTLIGLDSAVVTPALRATGRLGPDTLESLDRALQDARGAFRVVLIHHPPVPGLCVRRKALVDDRQLQEILVRQGAGLVLHGHLHRNGWHEQPLGREEVHPTVMPIVCTASASAAGALGQAAARSFEIHQNGGGFDVTMRLYGLDAGDRHESRLELLEERAWNSAG